MWAERWFIACHFTPPDHSRENSNVNFTLHHWYEWWLFLNRSIPINYSNCDVLQHLMKNNFPDWGKVYSGDNIKKCYILVLPSKTCSAFSYTEYKIMTWEVLKIYLFINILLTRIKLLKYYSSFSRMSLGWKADIFFVTLYFQTM